MLDGADPITIGRAFDAGAVDVLAKSELSTSRMARALGVARRIAQVEQRARRYHDQLHGLTSAALCIHEALGLDDALSTIVEEARRILGARQAVISLIDDPQATVLDAVRLRGWLGAPLLGRDGVPRGLLQLAEKEGGQFTSEDADVLTQLAQMACVAIENARLHEQAQSALRARDDVLAVVTHDLRSPLNVVVAGTELLLEGDLGEEARHQVAAIRRAGSRMDRLLHDLLDVARLERGQMRIEGAAEEVTSFVEEACDLLRPLARARGQRLVRQVPEETPPVWVDRSRVLQVLQNLIDNAIKFTPDGGTIRVEAETIGHEVRFAVRDTGQGIPREMLPHVFDRFWRSKDARSGVGLGLAIAKGFIEAHGGRIDVESQEGLGTSFVFTLPLAPQSLASPLPRTHA